MNIKSYIIILGGRMSKRKKILVIISVFLVITLGVFLYLALSRNKQDLNKDGNTGRLEIVSVTSSDKPLDLIRKNVVKVINKIENKEITGTGFFNEDGYLLTNSHIVDIQGDITVQYSDGNISKAHLISNEIISDVAVLLVDDVKALALPFGKTIDIDSRDDLYAIGYAIDLKGEASITKGILSARRSMGGVEYLQTDAAINSGFSGGPLLNSKGEVVGMNSLANKNATIGMAISSETLQGIVYRLINKKEVNYLKTERPKNALSSVLKETGYEVDDLYDEWQYFHEGDKPVDSKSDGQGSSNTTQRKLGTDCELKYLGVKGYDIGWDASAVKFQLYLINNEDKLDLVITPRDSNATYQVKDNQNLNKTIDGAITIIVTSEDKMHKKEYYIVYHNVMTTIKELKRVEMSVTLKRDYSSNDKVLQYSFDYFDSDNMSIAGYYKINYLQVELYACSKGDECSDDSEYVALKTYNLKQKQTERSLNVKLDEVKNLLKSGNYFVDGKVKVYSKITLVTLSQGDFTSKNYITISE